MERDGGAVGGGAGDTGITTEDEAGGYRCAVLSSCSRTDARHLFDRLPESLSREDVVAAS